MQDLSIGFQLQERIQCNQLKAMNIGYVGSLNKAEWLIVICSGNWEAIEGVSIVKQF